MKTIFNFDRYQRQLQLSNFTDDVQLRLLHSNILIIGVGGLGCPAIQYLTTIGIGHLGIIDDDIVSLSNLQRQILYTQNDIGRKKVDVIQERAQALNNDVKITTYAEQLTQTNALDLINQYDIILDCSDNFKTRYILSDACSIMHKPLVFGAVFQYEGQLAVFDGQEGSISYRDIFPSAPRVDESPNCIVAGVYNITTGIIGCLQANEAIKLISGIGDAKINKLYTVNVLTLGAYEITLTKNPLNIGAPTNVSSFMLYNYNRFCGLAKHIKDEINAEEFEQVRMNEDILLIDIRNENELPKVPQLGAMVIPMDQLKYRISDIPSDKKIILFCHAGIRSQHALHMLKEEFNMHNVCHLKAGLLKWLAIYHLEDGEETRN